MAFHRLHPHRRELAVGFHPVPSGEDEAAGAVFAVVALNRPRFVGGYLSKLCSHGWLVQHGVILLLGLGGRRSPVIDLAACHPP